MARPGKWDHVKPEVLRMIKEGFDWGEIMQRFPKLPKATLSGWFKQVHNVSSESSEPRSESPKLRLPIDPESPIERVRNALWDIVHDPEGKGVAVQALNAILKSFEVEARLAASAFDPDELSDAELEKIAAGQ